MRVPSADYWTPNEAKQAASLFATPLWQKMLSIVMLNKPLINPGEPEHTVTLKAYGRQTWEDCLNMFASLGQAEAVASEEDFEQIDTSKMSSKRSVEGE